MGNDGNTMDRWYRRGSSGPAAAPFRAFAVHAEASPS